MRTCAPSRAFAARSASRVSFEEICNGFGSSAIRSPRSKVYGVGFVTVTGSLEAVLVSSAIVATGTDPALFTPLILQVGAPAKFQLRESWCSVVFSSRKDN